MKYIAVIIIQPECCRHILCFAPAEMQFSRIARRDEFLLVWAKFPAAGSANAAQNGAAQENRCSVLRRAAENWLNYKPEARINSCVELKIAAGSPI